MTTNRFIIKLFDYLMNLKDFHFFVISFWHQKYSIYTTLLIRKLC